MYQTLAARMQRHQRRLASSFVVDGEARTTSYWATYNSEEATIVGVKGFPTSHPANKSLSMDVWRGTVVRDIPTELVCSLDPVPLILPASRPDLIVEDEVCVNLMDAFMAELVRGIREGDRVRAVTIAGTPQREAFLRAAGLQASALEPINNDRFNKHLYLSGVEVITYLHPQCGISSPSDTFAPIALAALIRLGAYLSSMLGLPIPAVAAIRAEAAAKWILHYTKSGFLEHIRFLRSIEILSGAVYRLDANERQKAIASLISDRLAACLARNVVDQQWLDAKIKLTRNSQLHIYLALLGKEVCPHSRFSFQLHASVCLTCVLNCWCSI